MFAMVAYRTAEDQWQWVLDNLNATVETLGCLSNSLNMSEKHIHGFSPFCYLLVFDVFSKLKDVFEF